MARRNYTTWHASTAHIIQSGCSQRSVHHQTRYKIQSSGSPAAVHRVSKAAGSPVFTVSNVPLSQISTATTSSHSSLRSPLLFRRSPSKQRKHSRLQLRPFGSASGLGAVLLQQLKRHNLHRLLVRALQDNEGRLARSLRLQPSRRAQTPAFRWIFRTRRFDARVKSRLLIVGVSIATAGGGGSAKVCGHAKVEQSVDPLENLSTAVVFSPRHHLEKFQNTWSGRENGGRGLECIGMARAKKS